MSFKWEKKPTFVTTMVHCLMYCVRQGDLGQCGDISWNLVSNGEEKRAEIVRESHERIIKHHKSFWELKNRFLLSSSSLKNDIKENTEKLQMIYTTSFLYLIFNILVFLILAFPNGVYAVCLCLCLFRKSKIWMVFGVLVLIIYNLFNRNKIP